MVLRGGGRPHGRRPAFLLTRRGLQLPDLEPRRSDRQVLGPPGRAFAELLISCEEDRALRAVLVGMLREADQGR
jgi:hypothetical protein